jgi:hypothetical protein
LDGNCRRSNKTSLFPVTSEQKKSFSPSIPFQGCQMVYFLTKNPNLGKFFEGHRCENVEYFTDIFGYFMTMWYILCSLGTVFRFWDHIPRKIWQPCSILQGDQMSLLKNRPRCSPMHNFVKSSKQILPWRISSPKCGLLL